MNPNLPSSITKGDSYTILESYTTSNLSGGSASCSSNLDGIITHTGQLTTVGTHTITCTVRTGSGKTATASKTIKITYTAYTITNLITNGSFENYVSFPNNIFQIVNGYFVDGEKSLLLNTTALASYKIFEFNVPINHKIYISFYHYLQNIIGNGAYVAVEIKSNPWLFAFSNALPIYWQKASQIVTTSDNSNTYPVSIAGWNSTSSSFEVTAFFDNFVIIDLTATFGSGNEPDKEWCNKHINYFDGSKIIYK